VLFNPLLLIHALNKTNQISVPAILPVWKKSIGLSENTPLAKMVLTLSLENFYLQITDETLNESWLKSYFSNIRQMVAHFRQSQNTITIDGSV
jgi:hypothetical protein